jgi:hypothetical protein
LPLTAASGTKSPSGFSKDTQSASMATFLVRAVIE